MEETIPEDVIYAMCLTWRHDFGIDAPMADKAGRMAWGDGASIGMTRAARDGLRMQMRQIYQHHVLPAIMAERARCLAVANGWLIAHGEVHPQHIDARQWASDAVADIADAIQSGVTP